MSTLALLAIIVLATVAAEAVIGSVITRLERRVERRRPDCEWVEARRLRDGGEGEGG